MKIRLNKFIANTGICSRREADKYIEAGVITVNNIPIKKLGSKINSTDIVKFNGEKITSDISRYILLNKPKNYSLKDGTPKHRSVSALIKNACKEVVFPINKLNNLETGLLLFTNDRELIKKLNNPVKKIKTIYHITLNKVLNEVDLNRLLKGVILNGKKRSLDLISYVTNKKKNEIGVENSRGDIRLIKQLFEKSGYRIIKLDRVFFAGLTKKDLPKKHYRHLSEKEITILKRI